MTVDQEFVEITELLLAIQHKQLAQDLALATLVGCLEPLGMISKDNFAALLIDQGAPPEIQHRLNEIAKMFQGTKLKGL